MLEITNIDLKFQRKARGIAPVSRFALSDEGLLLAAVPDEMEVRTFHVVRYGAESGPQVRDTYSVETLRKIEIAPDGFCLGTTEDDLYLFSENLKTRFLEGRRVSYTDVSLSADGRRFAAAFCDLLAAGHSLALGDSKGRLVWTKDIPFPISRVAVDRAGAYLALGGETGDLWLLDAWRNPSLRFTAPAPVTALATHGPGEGRTVFGTAKGVGVLDAHGGLLWFTELPGETLEVASDTAGTLIAALVSLDETSGRLIFLSHNGIPLWDVDYDEARPTGLSLSANGRFAAVSLRDGTLALYELDSGDGILAMETEETVTEARAAVERGDFRDALSRLRRRMDAVPSDADACTAFGEAVARLRERSRTAAANAEALGDFASADAQLAEAVAADPLDAELVALRRDLHLRWAKSAREAGEAALIRGDGALAEERFLEAIAADAGNPEIRRALGEARRAAAEAALARGRERLQARNFDAAISALMDARERGASGPEVNALLRSARAGEALKLGNELYQDRQYAAALFQFKKVLRFDPENAEARQKLSYSRTFLQDTALNDRFSRLE